MYVRGEDAGPIYSPDLHSPGSHCTLPYLPPCIKCVLTPGVRQTSRSALLLHKRQTRTSASHKMVQEGLSGHTSDFVRGKKTSRNQKGGAAFPHIPLAMPFDFTYHKSL